MDASVIARLNKRATEIESLAKQYESWSIGEAIQHAQDIRTILAGVEELTSEVYSLTEQCFAC